MTCDQGEKPTAGSPGPKVTKGSNCGFREFGAIFHDAKDYFSLGIRCRAGDTAVTMTARPDQWGSSQPPSGQPCPQVPEPIENLRRPFALPRYSGHNAKRRIIVSSHAQRRRDGDTVTTGRA